MNEERSVVVALLELDVEGVLALGVGEDLGAVERCDVAGDGVHVLLSGGF